MSNRNVILNCLQDKYGNIESTVRRRRANQDHSNHHIFIAHNPLHCDCINWDFLKYMKRNKFKVRISLPSY